MDAYQIGEYLEHQGATDEEIDDFLEHFGVKGMQWGVRRQNRAANLNKLSESGAKRFANRNVKKTQTRIDRISRVASGKATIKDLALAGAFNITASNFVLGMGLRGGAKRQLNRAAKYQSKIELGKKRTADALLKLQGIDIRELDYSYTN